MSNTLSTENFPWLQHYDPEVPQALTYPEATLFELFSQTAQKYPDVVALIFYGKKITYRDLKQYVDRVASALQKTGFQHGERIALLLPNSPQYVISYYAILSIGATVVPVNPLSTETELLHICKDGNVKGAICLNLLAGRLENVRKTLHGEGEQRLLAHTFYTSIRDFLPFPLNMLYPLKQKLSEEARKCLVGASKFTDLSNSSQSSYSTPPLNLYKDVAVLIYTGGTTGKPKGVMLSHYSVVANASQCSSWVQMSPADRIVTVLPTFHGFGMSVCMNAPIISGASMVLIPKFNIDEILKAIDGFRPSLFAAVPTIIIAMVNHPKLKKYDLSSLRGSFVGAAPLPPEIKLEFEELTGGRLMEGYGLTEAVTAICANPYHGVNKTGSIGIPFPDINMRIRDVETGERELAPGEIGELVLSCPDIMLGYYNRPMETASAIRDGWLYTGDLGYMDEEGYFYIVDRKKDMIITGGFNVYPREVEDVLYQHEAIKEACVIGIPDSYAGEKVKAFITLREGYTASEEDIVSFCRKHLLPYKVPGKVEIREDLPKTAIGKILKRALREQ